MEWGRIPSVTIQRITLFESPKVIEATYIIKALIYFILCFSWFQSIYLIGGNKGRTAYYILHIDRTMQDDLALTEEPLVYSLNGCMAKIKVHHCHSGVPVIFFLFEIYYYR